MKTTEYLGSKNVSGLFQGIIAAMPPHDTYIETRLGSGAILQKKPSSIRSIGLDLDAEVINSHKEYKQFNNVELHTIDALKFLKSFNFADAGKVLIYSDPPYLHSTRSSNKRYKHEYEEQDHISLLTFFKQLKNVNIMVSGYASQLYDDMLADWNCLSFQAMSRGGVRTEKLWLNYDLDSFFWHSYAGKNFTERQRIKRKAQRWADNYKKLPEMERMAILNALLSAH